MLPSLNKCQDLVFCNGNSLFNMNVKVVDSDIFIVLSSFSFRSFSSLLQSWRRTTFPKSEKYVKFCGNNVKISLRNLSTIPIARIEMGSGSFLIVKFVMSVDFLNCWVYRDVF